MNTTAVCEAKLGAIVFPVISDEPPRGYLQLLEPRVASEQLFKESLLKVLFGLHARSIFSHFQCCSSVGG